MRILVADKLAAEGLEFLKSSGFAYDEKIGLKEPELAAAVPEYDALIVRSGAKVTAKVLENPGKLRAIARAGVGVDNIDLPAATSKGILVLNTAAASTLSTAEHALALMMSLARKVPQAHQALQSRRAGVEEAQPVPGHATGRQDAGRGRPGPDRPDRRQPGAGDGDERRRLRPVLHRPRRPGRAGEAGPRLRRIPRPDRRHHLPRPRRRRHQGPAQPRPAVQQVPAQPADRQRRPRRRGGRVRPGRGAEGEEGGRRGPRRVRDRAAGQGPPAVRRWTTWC